MIGIAAFLAVIGSPIALAVAALVWGIDRREEPDGPGTGGSPGRNGSGQSNENGVH